MTIRVVYQDGVFRPLTPIDSVAEGTEAEVSLKDQPPRQPRPTPEAVRARLLETARMPLENKKGQQFSGIDHDNILYGKPKKI